MARWIKIMEDSGITTVINLELISAVTHYPHRNPNLNKFMIYLPGGPIEFREQQSPEAYEVIQSFMKELEWLSKSEVEV